MVPSVSKAHVKSRNHKVNRDIYDHATTMPQRANDGNCGRRGVTNALCSTREICGAPPEIIALRDYILM
jgi:hypothetical protein